MKTTIKLALLVLVALAGCQSESTSFTGTYVSHKPGVDDTLIISADHAIERRTGYGVHHEVEHWRTDLNTATNCLVERRYGKIISLSEDGIIVSKRTYQRTPIRVTIHNFLEHL